MNVKFYYSSKARRPSEGAGGGRKGNRAPFPACAPALEAVPPAQPSIEAVPIKGGTA